MLWAPLLIWFVAQTSIYLDGIDFQLATLVYTEGGERWALRDNFIVQTVIHRGGQTLCWLILASVLASYVASFRVRSLLRYRSGLGRLCVSMMTSAAVVALLKGLSPPLCPWDLNSFGGSNEFRALLSFVAWSGPSGHCWPAGHASAAFSLYGFYFFGLLYQRRWAPSALVLITSLGLVFGFAQQLRGAHFLSHDLWSMGICWTVSYLIWRPALAARQVASS